MNSKSLDKKHILIIVENLSLPFDRRVWQEANTLKEAGAEVSVVCPKMKDYTESYENINGIHIYRHPLPLEASGKMSYFLEYFLSLFWEFVLSWKIFFKKRFHLIQGCNPPDLIFIIALFFKPFGVKYVFDHHDINPELYIAKYNKKGLFYHCLLLAEKLTFKTAKYSIATNESYRKIAIERGGMSPDLVTVIRSGPKLDRLKIDEGNPKYKNGRKYLVGYIGVIGYQEGIDLLLESISYIVFEKKCTDIQFGIIGDGPELDNLKKLSQELKLGDYVDFYGRIDDKLFVEILNTADVCVNPDRPTIMNDLSTMNKIMEYMALKKPIVQYDLKEGRFSAQKASLYANNTQDFANKIIELLDDEEKRKEMGEFGYNRVLNELSWEHESQKLVDFYNKIFS